ncbi:MAG: hypothetical protein KAK00_10485 [Nanoarchaeota archaeon]|nr:hypothetical protein [Nanoarchaeota archaeon]
MRKDRKKISKYASKVGTSNGIILIKTERIEYRSMDSTINKLPFRCGFIGTKKSKEFIILVLIKP